MTRPATEGDEPMQLSQACAGHDQVDVQPEEPVGQQVRCLPGAWWSALPR